MKTICRGFGWSQEVARMRGRWRNQAELILGGLDPCVDRACQGELRDVIDGGLTFVPGRWLRPIVIVLHVVRRITFQPISSREQEGTGKNRRFGRDSFRQRSKA